MKIGIYPFPKKCTDLQPLPETKL